MRPNSNDQGFLASHFEFVNCNFIKEPRPNVAEGHDCVFLRTFLNNFPTICSRQPIADSIAGFFHGLKHRHLKRHARDVVAFFDALVERDYESDASKALQERLLRNRERLFTFLQYDGVSWNNNLAEKAIKRISDYREDVGRSVSEAGLTEHLVLLSIYHTCRVRDISFLKFLLSRERDIDAFAAGKRRRQRTPRIELYPKGYLPPSIGSLRRAQAARASDTIAAEAE